jgi:hypothetical protein
MGLNACQQESIIGLGIVKQELAQIVETDTFTVEGHTVLVDSIRSDRSQAPYLLTGQYNDPVLGKVTARSFLKIVSGVNPVKLPNDLDNPISNTIDSVVLVLGLQRTANEPTNIYPEHERSQIFALHHLTDTINGNKNYYAFDAMPYNPAPLAKFTVNLKTFKENKFVRVNLTTSSFLEGRALADTIKKMVAEETSLASFQNRFKGFAIIPEANTDANVIGFANDFTTNVVVHYTAKYAPAQVGLPNKNTPKIFPLLVGPHFYSLTSDRTGTPIAGITPWQPIPASLTNNQTFIQSGFGLYTRLKFPTLSNLTKLGNVVINKAVLTIKVAQDMAKIYPASGYVYLFKGNENGRFVKQTVNNVVQNTRIPFDGTTQSFISYNARDEQYEIPISRHAQFLMAGDEKNPYILVESGDMNLTVQRSILGYSSLNTPNKIRLKVYYTLFR